MISIPSAGDVERTVLRYISTSTAPDVSFAELEAKVLALFAIPAGLLGECVRSSASAGLRAGLLYSPSLEDHLADEDQIKTMVEYARDGKKADFYSLAGMLGINSKHFNELWAGTVKRAGGKQP